MSDWITDRPPTKADADHEGDVVVKQRPGSDAFAYFHWSFVKPGMAWQRTVYWSALQPADEPADEPAPEPTAPTTQPRRFVSISRTILKDGDHIIDAVDDEGTAWWRQTAWPIHLDWQVHVPLPARRLLEPAF